MPDEQRNPIQEYQVFAKIMLKSLWKKCLIDFHHLGSEQILVYGNIEICSLHPFCKILCLLYFFCLRPDPFSSIDIFPIGCSYPWCPFLRCRWDSRPNYKCEMVSCFPYFYTRPYKTYIHMYIPKYLIFIYLYFYICMYVCRFTSWVIYILFLLRFIHEL